MSADPYLQLILKEQDELNSWNRTVCQIYFAWYTAFFTLNCIAMTWIFANDALHKAGSVYVFEGFAFWNILGIASTGFVLLYVIQSSRRISEISQVALSTKAPDEIPPK